MKALHLIVVMALAYSGALAYLYFVFRLMLLIGEVVYEHSNICDRLDSWGLFWIRYGSSIKRKWEELICHFWARFSESLSRRSYSVLSILRRRSTIRSLRRRKRIDLDRDM